MSDRNARLTLAIEASHDADIELSVLTAKLEALATALNRLEHFHYKSTGMLVYRIADVHHSDATFVIEADAKDADQSRGHTVFHALVNIIRDLRGAITFPNQLGEMIFQAVINLAKWSGEKFSRIRLSVEENTANIDEELLTAIRLIQSKDTTAFGIVKGKVERFNMHGKYYFNIYPRRGPGVRCIFKPDLLDEAAASVARTATVSGVLKYREGEFPPYVCHVKSIDIHPKDDELPKLEDLRGVAPAMTGELSTVEFIRRIRNDWQD